VSSLQPLLLSRHLPRVFSSHQHLGQGANQALEDVSALSDLLLTHAPPSAFSDGHYPTTSLLHNAFNQLDARRIPRTSALVRDARAMGQQRVLPSGSKDAEERNRQTKENWSCAEEQQLQWYESILGPRGVIGVGA
jgi:hypothetical protein